jgi:hypothetical protein
MDFHYGSRIARISELIRRIGNAESFRSSFATASTSSQTSCGNGLLPFRCMSCEMAVTLGFQRASGSSSSAPPSKKLGERKHRSWPGPSKEQRQGRRPLERSSRPIARRMKHGVEAPKITQPRHPAYDVSKRRSVAWSIGPHTDQDVWTCDLALRHCFKGPITLIARLAGRQDLRCQATVVPKMDVITLRTLPVTGVRRGECCNNKQTASEYALSHFGHSSTQSCNQSRPCLSGPP